MSRDWYYVLGGVIIGVALITIGSQLKVGRAQVHYGWAVGLAGLASCLVAGIHAQGTWIFRFVGSVVKFNDFTLAVGFVAVLIGLLLSAFALIPNHLLGAVTVGTGVAIAWVFIPSALAHNVMPDPAGAQVQAFVVEVSKPLLENTKAFG